MNDALADELVGGHVREVEVELERVEGGEWGEGFGEVLLRAVRTGVSVSVSVSVCARRGCT